MCEAVNTISDVAQGKGPAVSQHPYDGPGELAAALDDFDVRTVFNCFLITLFGLRMAHYFFWEHLLKCEVKLVKVERRN